LSIRISEALIPSLRQVCQFFQAPGGRGFRKQLPGLPPGVFKEFRTPVSFQGFMAFPLADRKEMFFAGSILVQGQREAAGEALNALPDIREQLQKPGQFVASELHIYNARYHLM